AEARQLRDEAGELRSPLGVLSVDAHQDAEMPPLVQRLPARDEWRRYQRADQADHKRAARRCHSGSPARRDPSTSSARSSGRRNSVVARKLETEAASASSESSLAAAARASSIRPASA